MGRDLGTKTGLAVAGLYITYDGDGSGGLWNAMEGKQKERLKQLWLIGLGLVRLRRSGLPFGVVLGKS